jgi:REase_DpnII-MboI
MITSDKDLIARLLRRFHQAARQLKTRHSNRSGITIADEYDVQDILHSFLRGLFDDVRPEECTPSYAGGASRMDFLLKKEKIVIETKLASPTLRDKQIGEQLMVDIQRYSAHPDCRDLICFVYDPLGNVRNPAGLEADLSHARNNIRVQVVIVSV